MRHVGNEFLVEQEFSREVRKGVGWMEWVPGLSSNVDLKHWRHLEQERRDAG